MQDNHPPLRAFASASACGRAIFMSRATRACPVMSAAAQARSSGFMARSSIPTAMPTAGVKIRTGSIRSLSPPPNFGERPTTRSSISICGSLILKRRDAEILPGLPQNEAGPVFAAPWQAQAFAMTLALCEKGLFSWTEWGEILGEEIRTHPALDDGLHYYDLWLAALYKLLIRKGLTSHEECLGR